MPASKTVRFRQADVKRAVAGVMAGGMAVGQVSIDQDGRIVIRAAEAKDVPAKPFDGWKAARDARSA